MGKVLWRKLPWSSVPLLALAKGWRGQIWTNLLGKTYNWLSQQFIPNSRVADKGEVKLNSTKWKKSKKDRVAVKIFTLNCNSMGTKIFGGIKLGDCRYIAVLGISLMPAENLTYKMCVQVKFWACTHIPGRLKAETPKFGDVRVGKSEKSGRTEIGVNQTWDCLQLTFFLETLIVWSYLVPKFSSNFVDFYFEHKLRIFLSETSCFVVSN